MPIEDPTVEWTSAPVRLATISIDPQKCDVPEQKAFFENLSWTPWNALPEHRPLGGINRARKLVYEDSSGAAPQDNGKVAGHPDRPRVVLGMRKKTERLEGRKRRRLSLSADRCENQGAE